MSSEVVTPAERGVDGVRGAGQWRVPGNTDGVAVAAAQWSPKPLGHHVRGVAPPASHTRAHTPRLPMKSTIITPLIHRLSTVIAIET